ncbi:MAG: DUF3772 domain-containing protein, partial [Pseudomonadota bacterium]
MKRLVYRIVLLTFFAAGAAISQTESTVNYAAFERLADSVEDTLSAGDAPTSALESLRAELVTYRSQLTEAETANAPRVENIRSQIEALGPAPNTEAGETESLDLAARRAELQTQLEEARAPGLEATAAFQRANGLITEIDEEVRTRRNELLLEARPLPVNPANWPDALTAVTEVTGRAVGEVTDNLGTDWKRQELARTAPVTVVLSLIALLLLFRGRRWMARLTDSVQSRGARRGRITLGFLVSLGQVALPVAGMSLLAGALASSSIIGPLGQTLLSSVLVLVFSCYGAAWLLRRVFPVDSALPAAMEVEPGLQARARLAGILIGALFGVGYLLNALSSADEISPEAEAVLGLPVFVTLGLAFIWLARVLRKAAAAADEDGETSNFRARFLRILSLALTAVSIAGPLISAAGYHNLADAIMRPTALTVGLVGVFIALQAPIRDLYAWISGKSLEDARDALIPVLVNFAVVIAALPLLALIWGTRPAELGELYTRINQGIAVGDSRLTPGTILTVLIVFGIGFLVTRLLQGALKSTVLPRTKLDAGARNAVVSFAGYTGIGLAVLLAITAGGIDLTALAVVFGALSVGIGFGLQNVVQNFVAGIILLIERPIGEGDWIEVGGQMGIVKDISVRSTTIETFDKTQVIVPNADFISGTVTNWTRGSQLGRAIVTVGVAYGTDTRRVQDILMEIASENPNVARFPEPGVDFLGFGADSLDFRIRAILLDVNKLVTVQTELNHRIAERFTEEGIEIPFAQRDIWLRNPETLNATAPRPTAP